MKNKFRSGVFVATLCLLPTGQAFAESNSPQVTTVVVERGRHFKTVEVTGPRGVSRYTAIGNGMHWQDSRGTWIESKPVVQTYENAIVCTGASYRVIIARNLNTDGAVDLEMSGGDGQRFVSNPLSIGFYDPESGRSVMLARVKDCDAVVSSNRIVFPDAFEGSVHAAVTYSYNVGRFAQDVTLLTKPSVTPADFGMGNRTRLEVFSEILQSPAPTRTEQVLRRETNQAARARMIEPDLVNERIRFGEDMVMPVGRAFRTGQSESPLPRDGIPVAKRILEIEGRSVLVESVEWNEARKGIETLPNAAVNVRTNWQAGIGRQLPDRAVEPIQARGGDTPSPKNERDALVAQAVRRQSDVATMEVAFDQRLAQITGSAPNSSTFAALELPKGFLVDYEMIPWWSGAVLESGHTYLVTQMAWLEDVTFQSAAVLKFQRYASLWLGPPINSSFYGPKTVLTAVDDDTIGENIDGLPSVPSGYYGSGLIFEYFPDDEMIIGNFDIRHAWDAAYVSETTLFLYYSVFRNCSVGFQLSYATVYLSGVELCSVGTPSSSSSSYLYGSFMTCGQDSDSDGLPDMWEYQYFEDNLAQTGSGDYDGDGLTNQEEYELGLNPVVNDTAQLGSRLNYSYDATGRLQGVSGVRSEAVTSDGEGNIQGISQ